MQVVKYREVDVQTKYNTEECGKRFGVGWVREDRIVGLQDCKGRQKLNVIEIVFHRSKTAEKFFALMAPLRFKKGL